MHFTIKIKETLARTLSLEAESTEEALQKAERIYNDSEVILDSSDFLGVSFHVSRDQN